MSVTVTRSTQNGNATYTIAITATAEIADAIAAEASEHIYNTNEWIRAHFGGVSWGTLTNAQKMRVLGLYTQRVLRKMGYTLYFSEQQNAIADIVTHYGEE
jgi:hypothetical protein